MNRTIRRLSQWVLVVTLTTVLSTSPVSAGWLLHRMHCHHRAACCHVVPPPCPPVTCAPACPPPAPACCPAPVDCCASTPIATVPATVVDSCPCGCGESISDTAPMIDSAPSMQGAVIAPPIMEGNVIESAPIESFDSTAPADNWVPSEPDSVIESSSDAPADDVPEEPTEAPQPPADEPLNEVTPEDPAPADEPPADEAPADPAPFDPAPADAAPAEPAPADDAPAAADDIFGDPPADAATPDTGADDAMDDLFGDPPATDAAPADPAPESEAPEQESSIDDLFGVNTPAETADAPAEVATEQPVGEATDDLFGDAPADTTEATEAASDGLDDLFGGEADAAPADAAPADAAPADGSEAPADSPVEPTEKTIDDLFGDAPADDVSPAETPTDEPVDSIEDLFGDSPSIEPAEPKSIDDLFGFVPADHSVQELPAPANVNSTEVPVKSVSVATQPVNPLANTHVRTWIDNSGSFSTAARLIEINRDNVRLLKTSGRICTVPNHRLSEADAAYVDAIRDQLERAPLVAMAASN